MYKKVTKKLILEGAKICHEHGYWSQETNNFLNKFEYTANQKINTILASVYNSNTAYASCHYQLFKDNNLI